MRINRGLVFWGVALITAGAVALAIQSGVIAGESARDLWRFWPVVLIVIVTLAVLTVVVLVMYARRVEDVEVVATLLFVPIFLAFVFRGVLGGVVAAVASG